MKRALCSLLVSALILSVPTPQAWAVVAANVRAVPVGAASGIGAAGAVRFSVPAASLTALPVNGLGLNGAAQLAPALPGALNAAPLAVNTALSAPQAAPAASAVNAAPVAPAAVAAQSAANAAPAPLAGLKAAGEQSAAYTAADASEGAVKTQSGRAFDLSAVKTSANDGVLGSFGAPSANGLAPASQSAAADAPRVPSAKSANGGAVSSLRRSLPVRALITVARVAAGAGAVIGLQAAAVAFLPAIFGAVPVAAVWAISSGLLLVPVALYARYRLARRDSPRLEGVKGIADLALGAFGAAVYLALPSLAVTVSGGALAAAAVPLIAMGAGRWLGNSAFADSMLTWAALGAVPMAVAAAGVPGLIGVSSIAAIMALPALTTISFFLGRLIYAAETGQPFGIPGTMQKLRFPSFQWVMIGVVFALLTGYSAVYTNIAFLVWTITGGREGKSLTEIRSDFKPSLGGILATLLNILTFDRVFLGLLAYTAFTGFASPLTFLVIAFAGERAAVWTERLLVRFLRPGAPAPSTKAAPAVDPSLRDAQEPSWPQYHYWTKMALLLGSMGAMGLFMGATVFGFQSLFTNLAVAGAMAFIPFFFANWIIKKVMRTTPADESVDPEFFGIMRELRERINAARSARGKKPIPMPEMVIDPMEAPNAYATGRSPFKATVGMTRGIRAMTLEPENVREGVIRLISVTPADTKAYRVFRMAIAGSISGVPANADPAQLTAALVNADHVQLKALGVRMLRGVMGHEFSHVMDRHMLSGSVAGAISSGVAFASYGVMWAVGHAQVALGRLKDKILGRKPAPPAGGDQQQLRGGDGARPEAVDPISTGIVLKSLPALAKVFAALWVPILLQIMQMAASRNNEGMADEDGALLSEDPESLALALGLLTTWRPPQGFSFPGMRVPTLMALSHITTVNPFEQLNNAGAMPKLDAFTQAVVGRGDDFLLELFITHPNTGVRISKLHDMAEALRAARPRRGPPAAADSPKPDPEGGPPQASIGPAAGLAPAVRGGGLFQGAWKAASGLFRVLPDEGRNAEFWKYTLGQAVMSLGVNFHYTALPGVVAPTKADSANMGINRSVNWAAQAVSGFATGPLVDRSSTQGVIVWTYALRALLMLAVPALFFTHGLSFWMFTAVIGAAGFLQMTGMTAQAVAFNRILADDEAHYNRANGVSTFVLNAAGVVGPILAGSFIGWLNAALGPLAGNTLAYGVYGATLGAVALFFALKLKLPRDETTQARRGLGARLRKDGVGPHARYKGVTARHEGGKPVLLVEVSGDAALAVVPFEHDGYAVRAVPQRQVLKELVEGVQVVYHDRYLKYYLLFMSLSLLAGDALVFAAIPRYIADVLHLGIGASFGYYLSAMALGSGLGSALMTLLKDKDQAAFSAAAKGLRRDLAAAEPELAAERLSAAEGAVAGAYPALLERVKAGFAAASPSVPDGARLADDAVDLASAHLAEALQRPVVEARGLLLRSGAERALRAWAARRGEAFVRTQRSDARTGYDRLQRQGRWTSFLYGFGWLAYIGAFYSPTLWGSVAFVLASAFLATPAMVAWSSLTTKVLQTKYPDSQGKVYSAMYVYQLLWSIAGIFLFGALLTHLSTSSVILVTSLVLAACALQDFIEPFVIFPLRKGDRK